MRKTTERLSCLFVGVLMVLSLIFNIPAVAEQDDTAAAERRDWANYALSVCGTPDDLSDAEAVSYDIINALVNEFEDNEYAVVFESVDPESPELLRGRRHDMILSGAPEVRITIYEYPNPVDAQADALCLDESGSTLNYPGQTIYIEWINVPHFYLADNLIIQYIGVDDAILQVLTNQFGETFAGGYID